MSPPSSSSPSASNALYHPIPQAPVAVAPIFDAVTEEDEELDAASTPATKSLPIDNRIWWIHYILGCAVLLPWNVLITATPYFLSQLRASSLRTAFNSYLSISFTLANFIFVFFATVTAKQSSPSRRIFLTSTVLTILVFLLTIHTFITLPPTTFFFVILINSILQAAAGAYLQCAVVAIASLFGPIAMQACMSGQAGVAVAISSVQVLSAIASLKAPTSPDSDPSDSNTGTAEARAAMFFFAVSTIFLIGTIFAQAWLIRMPAYKVAVVPTDGDKNSTSPLSAGTVHLKGNIWRILRTNATFEFAASYVFLITLAVFPPVTASVQPINQSFNPLLFNSIHFLIFSIGDLLGRHFCSIPRFTIWNPKKLCTYSLLRTIFIPLFLLCNVQKPSSPSSTSTTLLSPSSTPLINSDALFFLILLAFGISNGHVSSMCMMAAPSLEHNPLLRGRRSDVDLAATIMAFCMVGGLVVGSAMSFAVRAAICGCNPFVE